MILDSMKVDLENQKFRSNEFE